MGNLQPASLHLQNMDFGLHTVSIHLVVGSGLVLLGSKLREMVLQAPHEYAAPQITPHPLGKHGRDCCWAEVCCELHVAFTCESTVRADEMSTSRSVTPCTDKQEDVGYQRDIIDAARYRVSMLACGQSELQPRLL